MPPFKAQKERYCPCGCGQLCKLVYDQDGRFKGYSHRAPQCPTSFTNLHSPNPAKGHRGTENPHWRPEGSTSIVERSGKLYRLIKIGEKWRYEHRYVMEQHLGRPLLSHEHVHHKKEKDTLNNSFDNLELLTASAHTTHHVKARSTGWEVYYDGCLLCGTTEKKYCCKGLCITCSNRTYRADNPEKIQTYSKNDYLKHKTKRNASSRAYHHAHKEAMNARSHAYYHTKVKKQEPT